MDRPLDLRTAMRLDGPLCAAFTGAGGKSAAIFELARRCTDVFGAALVTTTTHLSTAQAARADRHLSPARAGGLQALEKAFPEGVLLFTGEETGGRLGAVSPDVLSGLSNLAEFHRVPLLVEADGSRMRPLKAPADHEPAVPDFSGLVVAAAGLRGLGRPLDDTSVHRPERFSRITGLAPGARIRAADIAAALLSDEGGLKGIPPGARRVALLNQADTETLQAAGGGLAPALLEAYDAVVISALEPGGRVFAVHEPIAGVVLAAGGSNRLGRPKQLISWKGRPLVTAAVEAALRAGCSPVVVVTGAAGERVGEAVEGMPAVRVHNDRWQEGQSSSLKAGLQALPERTGAAVFLLADQPFVGDGLVRALMDAHRTTLAPIVAPLIDGRRGNPVLFDRTAFKALQAVTGDAGGRAVFSKFPVHRVPWHDARALLDVDTPDDLEALYSL